MKIKKYLEEIKERVEKGDRKIAVILLVVGILGLFLPIIPGILFIGLGIYTLTNGKLGRKKK